MTAAYSQSLVFLEEKALVLEVPASSSCCVAAVLATSAVQELYRAIPRQTFRYGRSNAVTLQAMTVPPGKS